MDRNLASLVAALAQARQAGRPLGTEGVFLEELLASLGRLGELGALEKQTVEDGLWQLTSEIELALWSVIAPTATKLRCIDALPNLLEEFVRSGHQHSDAVGYFWEGIAGGAGWDDSPLLDPLLTAMRHQAATGPAAAVASVLQGLESLRGLPGADAVAQAAADRTGLPTELRDYARELLQEPRRFSKNDSP